MGRLNGWKPDRPDARDRLYGEISPGRLMKALRTPDRAYVHLDNLPVVVNQGNIGSCVGHGVAELCSYVLDYLYDSRDAKNPDMLSRLFAYYNAREDKDQDTGAFIRDGIKGVVRYGICDEKYWPYQHVEQRFAVRPSAEAYAQAAHRAQGIEYFRLTSHADRLDCLAQNFPIVFGMTLFSSFQDIGADGLCPMPGPHEGTIGGHCMLLIGYSKKKRAYYARNSWGPDWGYHGNLWIPFDYIDRYASDHWTIRRLTK